MRDTYKRYRSIIIWRDGTQAVIGHLHPDIGAWPDYIVAGVTYDTVTGELVDDTGASLPLIAKEALKRNAESVATQVERQVV